MKSKFIYAGLVAAGGVFGWAVTADKAARDKKLMLAEFEEFLIERDEEWGALLNDKTEQIFALKHQISSAEVKQIVKPIPSFREGRLLSQDEVPQVLKDILPEGTEVRFVSEDMKLVPTEQSEDTLELVSDIQPGETPPEDLVGEDPGDAEIDENNFEEPVIDESEEQTRTNLQELIARFVPNEEEQEAFVAHAQTAATVDRRPAFVISQETFAHDEEGEHFTKVAVLYYPNDRVLLDDNEEPIEDINMAVGFKNLNRFGDESHDPDVVYVRNPRMETDFEVIRQEPDKELPLHVRYGMDQATFETRRASGLLRLRPGDE